MDDNTKSDCSAKEILEAKARDVCVRYVEKTARDFSVWVTGFTQCLLDQLKPEGVIKYRREIQGTDMITDFEDDLTPDEAVRKFMREDPSMPPDDRKPLNFDNITASSTLKVLWRCDKGHEWVARICDRTSGQGCPRCVKKKRSGK